MGRAVQQVMRQRPQPARPRGGSPNELLPIKLSEDDGTMITGGVVGGNHGGGMAAASAVHTYAGWFADSGHGHTHTQLVGASLAQWVHQVAAAQPRLITCRVKRIHVEGGEAVAESLSQGGLHRRIAQEARPDIGNRQGLPNAFLH